MTPMELVGMGAILLLASIAAVAVIIAVHVQRAADALELMAHDENNSEEREDYSNGVD